MTALVIIFSVLFGALYHAVTGNVIEIAGLRIYVIAYVFGLGTASVFAFRASFSSVQIDGHPDDKANNKGGNYFYRHRCFLGALVLILNFFLTHLAWQTSDPVLWHSIADLATAAWFVLGGRTRWELILGFLFLASVFVGFLTALGAIPDASERAPGFIALSHPDLVAWLGNIANALLGFASNDTGKWLRSWRGQLAIPISVGRATARFFARWRHPA